MKNVMFAVLAVTILCSVSFAAGPKLVATSDPVVLQAIIPEYIGLAAQITTPVVFDFTGYQDRIASGDTTLEYAMVNQGALPRWNLTYNLRHRTVTVCAYATNLQGTHDKIPAKYIVAQSLQNGSPYANFAGDSKCNQPNAVFLDQIKGATSSFNHGGPVLEGFKLLQLSAIADGKTVPTPDVYTGSIYIVAQAI